MFSPPISKPILHLQTVDVLESTPKMGVSFLPLPPLLFISLVPWSLGPRETAYHTDITLLPPSCSWL